MAQITVGDPTCGSDSASSSTTTSTSLNDWCNLHSAQQGWECPRCGRINAPWVRQCDCPRNNWTITWTSNNNEIPDWKHYATCCSTTVSGSNYQDPITKTQKKEPKTYTNVRD